MRKMITESVFIFGLMLHVHSAVSQTAPTPPTNADDGSPYGGIPVTPGSLPVGAGISGPLPPSGSTPCVTGTATDPCVLTGQYNRYRTSTNTNESSLAGFNNSSFGMAYFYQLTSIPPSLFPYEPVIAQPLYITHVTSNSTVYNMLIVASLNDYVYAFDTGTGNQIWPAINLANATGHCTGGTGGQPFLNNYSGLPGAAGLPYYGVVATPVIDTAPANPTMFVTSACTDSTALTTIRWFLDAIDLTTGSIVSSQPLSNGSTFHASNQLSRASILLTHPAAGGTYVYIAFGTGVQEIGAVTNSQWQYSGVLFGYKYTYSSSMFSGLTSSPFYTEGSTSGLFPSVYSTYDGNGFPLGPAGGTPANCTLGLDCSPGSNWAVNGGGIWMSSKGPSSVASSHVYFGSGNGAFSCNGSGPNCTFPTNTVYNWGESAIELPDGNSTSPMTPIDFFAPYVQRYTCPPLTPSPPNPTCVFNTQSACGALGYGLYQADCSPASYQTEELSRLDQDFGLSGEVIIPHTGVNAFAMTSDKAGYLYVMPTKEATGGSLGQFQQLDGGLSDFTYKTQTPFQVSRHPLSGDPTPVCPSVNSVGKIIGTVSCDEVHELAWFSTPVAGGGFSDLMFAWPSNETVEAFKGMLSNSNKTYKFGTTPQFDPCPGLRNCTNFPASDQGSSGAPMAVAVNTSASPAPLATLWAVVPRQANLLGALYGYTVNADNTSLSFGNLTRVWSWDNGTTTHACSSNPAGITGWWGPTFTEPTLADNQQNQGTGSTGAVYVPTICAETDNLQTSHMGCYNASQNGATLVSGVLVFTTCP